MDVFHFATEARKEYSWPCLSPIFSDIWQVKVPADCGPRTASFRDFVEREARRISRDWGPGDWRRDGGEAAGKSEIAGENAVYWKGRQHKSTEMGEVAKILF